MATKTFGPKTDDVVEDIPSVDFELIFMRDGVREPHTFTARPRLSYKSLTGAAKAQTRKGGGSGTLLIFERLIRPSLVDDDGTPAKWAPEIESREFVDPDGKTRPASELSDVQAFDKGSSRRRWVELMDDDDDVSVELEHIAEVYEYLVEEAADRPTRKSSR